MEDRYHQLLLAAYRKNTCWEVFFDRKLIWHCAFFAGPKRGRPTPGFSIFIRLHGRIVCLLRWNFGPYTFIKGQKGQRDKGTKGQKDKGTKGKREKREKGTKGQRDKGTKGLGNLETLELWNIGIWELGNLGTWELWN